ncbi:hypothetical protein GO495_12850 [Chitinophaga oryziterrae]|uniref:Putative endonuclease Z1 domain-containing protein n=1 Tax=Chitinophaga oryziterrae TaxID=1031224 RepID=A0A6N8J8B7_9BACT|nr:Z1 domain-containing protein [Chitinophaga oryziterrae]MVT41477.1 hypothetical protein [Chitinophaga oryziterrae]
MTPQEIIDGIKTIIRLQNQNKESVSLQYFSEKKPAILSILKIMIQSALENTDESTISSYYETAVKEYVSVHPVDIDTSSSLTKKGFKTWLTEERKKKLPLNYINRYLTYLSKIGRSDHIIEELSRASEAILGKLGDPQSSEAFYKKGLVVGSVQSGKTGNFNAVINRAVDAGYNLIIILSGIMEDLRIQTQLRLETDVIGEGHQGIKGVGKEKRFGMQGLTDIPQVISITSHRSDFKKYLQDANFSLNHKNILVCKKNTGVLKNLLIWLSDLTEASAQHNIPLLIIDDEADNASLNNLGHKGREYASTINGHIRAILGLFTRKTYLGYTGTPFANVLQDRNEEAIGLWPISYKLNGEIVNKLFGQVDNIFPEDFIELLESPSNYIGAKQIFETLTDSDFIKIPLVEPVTDCAASFPSKVVDDQGGTRPATLTEIEDGTGIRSPRKDDLFPSYLPDSMKEAIECFILGIAIRLKRRPAMVGSALYMPHNTMLIHVSRFSDWQNRTRNLVNEEIEVIMDRINAELPTSPDSIYAKLEKTWNKYYALIVANIRTYLPVGYADEFLDPVTFDEIKSLFPDAVKGIEVKAINNITKEKLVYNTDSSGNGKKYIAVGGNRLSRGFTLEGLTINYFIRDTNYADTLLQMGRWFGYRPGYIDCCKLFTTWDSIEKFDAATRTIEELEMEFKKMHRDGKTPEDFILRVRTHPGVLKITRPSILKNTVEVNWSYQDTLVQTTQFEMNASRINNSWSELKDLFRANNWSLLKDRGFYFIDTDVQGLFSFLNCANAFYEYKAELSQIKAFIELCLTLNKLSKWRVAVKFTGGSQINIPSSESGLPGNVKLSVRSAPLEEKQPVYYKRLLEKKIFTGSGKSANIISSGLDMALWLENSEISFANKKFIDQKIKEYNKTDVENAEKKAREASKPERIYRELMSDETGLLVIYLMDLREVFNNDSRLKQLKENEKINDEIPLIGYAIGFPKMSSNIGGKYVRGNYNIDEDEPEADEYDEETLNALEEII